MNRERLRDALLLTLSCSATTLATVVGILIGWNVGVVDTFLPGSSFVWLVGLIALAIVGWVSFALCPPPRDRDRI